MAVERGKDFWGKRCWAAIHDLSITVTPETRSNFCEFINLLVYLLPCEECCRNLSDKLRVLSPEMSITETGDVSQSAFMYTYTLHDLANQHITALGVENPKYSPDYGEALGVYQSRAKEGRWMRSLWEMIHIFATTLKQPSAVYFKNFLEVLCGLIPQYGDALQGYLETRPVERYLGSHSDAFAYTYQLHAHLRTGSSPPFADVRAYYFYRLFAR